MKLKSIYKRFKKPDTLFGVKLKTAEQRRFMKYFIIIKSIVYLVIFILLVIFLLRLRSIKV